MVSEALRTRKILTGYKSGGSLRTGLHPRIASLLNRPRQVGTFSRWPRLGIQKRRESHRTGQRVGVDDAHEQIPTNVSHVVASSVAAGRLSMVVFTGSPASLALSWTGQAA